MTVVRAAAILWPLVVVALGLLVGRVLRQADEGSGWLSRGPGRWGRRQETLPDPEAALLPGPPTGAAVPLPASDRPGAAGAHSR